MLNDLNNTLSNRADIADLKTPFNELRNTHKHGLKPGKSTGWRGLDEFFQFPPYGNLNIVTGSPGSGKSEWVDSLSINMALKHNWKVFVYSPENNPLDFHLQKLVQKLTNKAFSGNWNGFSTITDADIDKAQDFIEKHFSFVSCHLKGASVEEIINGILTRCISGSVDMVIIDPWNKIENAIPVNMNERKYISKSLCDLQMVAREKNISVWIVAHPAKPTKNKNGKYPEITLYDISGSGDWYNMTDNGFILHRSWEDKIGTNNLSKIKIAKIKDNRYGKCGEHYFKYLPHSTGYVDVRN